MTTANRHAAFRARLQGGETLFAGWSSLPDPLAAELLVREGFDCAVVDLQHGAADRATAQTAIAHVALAGRPCLVRVPVGDVAGASRFLDAGAAGIIAPMINTAAQARELAAFTKLPPLGERSWGPYRAMPLAGLGPAAYLAEANAMTLTLAMVETRAALAALDDILATPGIDGVFVGPNDLCIALTDGAAVDADHPEVDRALDHVAARARAHGKLASAFCFSAVRAGDLARRGFGLLSIGTDALLLRAAAREALAQARAIAQA